MKRQLFTALALVLLPSLAHALPAVRYLQLDGYDAEFDGWPPPLYPCDGTSTQKTIHARAFIESADTDPAVRIRWHVDGPNNGGDGALVSKVSPNDIVGSDLEDTYTTLVHCDEWGYYRVWAELLAPSGEQGLNGWPLSYFGAGPAVDTYYEASFHTDLNLNSPSVVKNSCTQYTMTGYLVDSRSPGQYVGGFPVHAEVTAPASGGGTMTVSSDVSTGCVSCGGNKGKFTIVANFSSSVANGTLSFWTKHGSIGTFPDPFYSKTYECTLTACVLSNCHFV